MRDAFGLEVPETLEKACDPTRTALLVCDMQVGVLRQVPKRDEVVHAVGRVLAAARSADVRVFFVRHMSLPKNIAGVFQLRQAMAWQRVKTVEEVDPWFLRDSPGFPITPEVEPKPTEAVFDKITMSAFEGTPLDIALRDCGLNAFVIVGVATEVGITPTVRHACDSGLHTRRRNRRLRCGRRGGGTTGLGRDRVRWRRLPHEHRDHLRDLARQRSEKPKGEGLVRPPNGCRAYRRISAATSADARRRAT